MKENTVHIKLQNLRKKRGLNYAEMANQLNVSKPYYWQLENGKRNISYKMAVNISKILKTKPDALFYDDFSTK